MAQKVHKSLGYANCGFILDAACGYSPVFWISNHIKRRNRKDLASRLWKNVNCEKCLKFKREF